MKLLGILALLFVVLIPLGYYFVQPKEKTLPVLNPIDLNASTVDPELLRLGHGHTIQEFEFTNQKGQKVSSNELSGRIWVAEYFFTNCGSICPVMNEQLKRVHEKYKSSDEVRLLSFTVDPENDTPEVLNRYAIRKGAGLPQWHFFTGEKADLYQLARKSFFLLKPTEVAQTGDAGSDFIHTNNFVLVDSKKRIRGYYDGTDPKKVDQLMTDIQRLIDEENN